MHSHTYYIFCNWEPQPQPLTLNHTHCIFCCAMLWSIYEHCTLHLKTKRCYFQQNWNKHDIISPATSMALTSNTWLARHTLLLFSFQLCIFSLLRSLCDLIEHQKRSSTHYQVTVCPAIYAPNTAPFQSPICMIPIHMCSTFQKQTFTESNLIMQAGSRRARSARL